MSALIQTSIPRLRNGDHLSRAEFERRYWPMTEVKKAELIEGIVYMPERVPVTTHGEPHAWLCGWLVNYCLKIPELRAANSSSCRLDDRNEFQPDLLVLLPKSHGGTSIVDEDDFVLGAPDFVAEIAYNESSIELHAKKEVYRRSGVREYLVLQTEDRAVSWFSLQNGSYTLKQSDSNNVLKSELLPGLWLDVSAVLGDDITKLFATLDGGLASHEHAAFVQQLAAK